MGARRHDARHALRPRLRADSLPGRGAPTIEIACNWKVACDASNESYHIPAVHPELLQVYDEKDATEVVVAGDHAYSGAPFATPSSNAKDPQVLDEWLRELAIAAGLDPSRFEGRATEVRATIQASLRTREFDFGDLSDAELTDYYYSYFFFPNVHFDIQGVQLNISRLRPHASDPGITYLDPWTLERRSRGEKPWPRPDHEQFRHGEGSLGLITDQDTATYIRVHRGLRSSGIERIILGDREVRIRHMHRTLDRYLAGPRSGTDADP